MKYGRSLTDLAVELDRQMKSKKDYLADTRSIVMAETGDTISLAQNGTLKVTDLCHDQIANRLGIPVKYYEKMRVEYPGLLAQNVNAWMQRNPEKRMVRTLDGRARAFLSDRFRPLDNYDLAAAVLPKIKAMQCKIESCELTETPMYLKAVTDRITSYVKVGDAVQAGIVISNSEIGHGSIKIEPMVYRLSCLNGMISPDFGMKKYHVGRGGGDIENDAIECFRDETRRADDRAFWMKVKDVVDATMTKERFQVIVNRMKEAVDRPIEGNPVRAVEEISKRYLFSEPEHDAVIKHLIHGGDLSAYGMLNAITQTSQDIVDYDRATEFERFGGQIIDLTDQEWKGIAKG